MKFTSIVFAAVVAATQFSFAQAAVTANPDSASTTDGVPVTFDVLTNDSATTGTPTLYGFGATGTEEVSPGGVLTTVSGKSTFTPTAGFTGTISFDYEITDGVPCSPGSTTTAFDVGTVTITVGAAPPNAAFVNPFGGKKTTTAAAVNTVRGGLFNVAALTPAGPDNAALTALLAPVSDNANFASNTSLDVVQESFAKLFAGFFATFRAGGVFGPAN